MATRQSGSTMLSTRKSSDPRGVLLMLVGSVLIVLGGVLLVSVGLIALDILANPSEVAIIALILEQMQGDGNALFGNIAGSEFAIGIGEPLRTLLFLVLAVWLLGALVSILKTVVLTGKELLSQSRRPDAD